MVAILNPKAEAMRPTPMPVKPPAPIRGPEAADDDDPMIWRESDFAPIKVRGKPLSEMVIEDRR